LDKTQTWKAADGRTGRIPTFHEVLAGVPAQIPESLPEPVMKGVGGEELAYIKHLVKLREQARAEKDWAQSDKIRDDLKALGVDLQDKDKIWKSKTGHMGIIVGYRGTAGPSDHEITVLVSSREKARHSNDYATSDMIRDELRAYGVDLNDKLKVWRTLEGRQGSIPTWQSIQLGGASSRVGGVVGAMPLQPMGFAGAEAAHAGDVRQQVIQAALQAASNPATAARTLQLLQTVGGASHVGIRAPALPTPPPRPGPAVSAVARSPEANEAAVLVNQIQTQNRLAMDPEIDRLVSLREKVRQAKDFAAADELRELFRSVGIELQEREKRWTTTDGRVGAIPLWTSLV